MIRLIDRLFSQPVGCDPKDKITVRMELSRLRKAKILILDNVAEYYAELPQATFKFSEFPNIAPPFNNFWLEWNEPKHWLIDGKWQDPSDTWSQLGLSIKAMEAETLCQAFTGKPFDNSLSTVELAKFLEVATGCNLAPNRLPYCEDDGTVRTATLEEREEYINTFRSSRWLLQAVAWMSAGTKFFSGRAFCIGAEWTIGVKSDGTFASMIRRSDLSGAEAMKLDSAIHIACLGLSFMHCRNVETRDSTAELGPSGRFQRFNKTPKFTYNTIQIGGIKKSLNGDGKAREQGLAKALHICRGHWATYTPEKPLFGKLVGKFWIPDHERGSLQQGRAESRYQVGPHTG